MKYFVFCLFLIAFLGSGNGQNRNSRGRPQQRQEPSRQGQRQGQREGQRQGQRQAEIPPGTVCDSPCICQQSQVYCAKKGLKRIPQKPWPPAHTVVNLDQNAISSIEPGTFEDQQLRSVVSLSMSFNELTELAAESFSGLIGVREITINSNKLTSLSRGAFDGLTGIETINLNKNKLTHLDAAPFSNLDSLRKISLDGNALETIAVDFFDTLVGIQQLSVGDNPWKCDCGMLGLFIWMSVGNQLQGKPTCKSPQSMAGRSMQGFTYKDIQTMCKEPWEDEPSVTSVTKTPEMMQAILRMNETCTAHNSTLPVEICFISEDVSTYPGRYVCLHCMGSKNPKQDDVIGSAIDDVQDDININDVNISWNIPETFSSSPEDSDRVTRHNNGTICIKDIQVNDGGKYECSASVGNFTHTDSVVVSVANVPIKVAVGVVTVFFVSLAVATVIFLRWWNQEIKSTENQSSQPQSVKT